MNFNEHFFKVLFWHLPVIAALLDQEQRVHLVNRTLQVLFHHDAAITHPQTIGDYCTCAYASREPLGCGHAPQCKKCIIRNTVSQAIHVKTAIQDKGSITVQTGSGVSFLKVFIAATPLEVNGSTMALLIMQDIANITQLNGLLPICSCCKKIRTADGRWLNLERYIERHSEAQFTHDYCPECLNHFYLNEAKDVPTGK